MTFRRQGCWIWNPPIMIQGGVPRTIWVQYVLYKAQWCYKYGEKSAITNVCVTRVIARLHTLNVLSKNFWTEYWPCSSRRGLQNEVDFCNSTFSNCTFFRFLEHCAVPSLSRKEHVSHGFSSDTLRKKGVAARVENAREYKKGGRNWFLLWHDHPASNKLWDRRISESIIRSVEHGSGIMARESPIF